MDNKHIVVIGGGIIGTTTALMLKWYNPIARVTLIE